MCSTFDQWSRKQGNNTSAPANPCSTFAAPCVSRRGSDGNLQLTASSSHSVQNEAPDSKVCRRYGGCVSHVSASSCVASMSDESLTTITCASSAFSPASVDVGVQESLLAMQSFADDVTVESPFGGVAPIRRNHGTRGLLSSACVSLRHMARIRPATVLQNLKQCICHGRLAKCQFRPQRAKVQEHICVFYDALLRVLAVGAQHTWDS